MTSYPWRMATGSLEKVLRFGEGRRMKRLQQQAAYVATLEPEFEALSDEELAAKTVEFKQRVENGEALEELVFDAYAAVREAFKRTLGVRLFDVQVMGGIVLHEGDIAEMKTGEGKTFVAAQALYLNSLSGDNVHLVTVNDYLAKRDANWVAPVYEKLGVRGGWIENMMSFEDRRDAYAAEITYGTNSEFGFDYLRDNMSVALDGVVQRGHTYAIVDEVDSILIDEARTPLIISGEPETAAEIYYTFARIVRGLTGIPTARVQKGIQPDEEYEFDEKRKTIAPYPPAIEKVEKALRIDNLYDPRNQELVNHLVQALKAESLYQRDVDYVVQVGGVAPGGRGQGGRPHSGGARHAGDDHAPELLPPLREARRHDRHGQDRGEGVRRDLRPARRGDPDQPAGRPRRQQRLHFQDQGRQVSRRDRGHQGTPRSGPTSPCRLDRGRDLGVPVNDARACGDPAQRAQREAARARGGDHQGCRPEARRHDRDQHGRPRGRHQARRGRARARRPLRARHRAP